MKDKKGKQADLFANQCTCGKKYEDCDRRPCPTFEMYVKQSEKRWGKKPQTIAHTTTPSTAH